MTAVRIADELAAAVDGLRFGRPVAYVYNPLVYARAGYHAYLRRYGRGRRQIVLFGMNPGPWGMAQTGVPFGDVRMVRGLLGIEVPVDRPAREHPKRPVLGFACTRSEVSGTRLWGWVRDRYATPRQFFSQRIVLNYCPLAFLEAGGRNLTPDKLPVRQRAALLAACDEGMRRMVALYRPRVVIGIGGFAEQRARVALAGQDVQIMRMLHPSPASPAANSHWAREATRVMEEAERAARE